MIEGAKIHVDGACTFSGPKQNTVFLKCDAPELRAVWYKPDFPNFSPHLTIYDGSSSTFAEELARLLEDVQPSFSFTATELRAIVSRKNQSTFDLRASLDIRYLSSLLKAEFDVDTALELDAAKRLSWISQLFKCLPHRGQYFLDNLEPARVAHNVVERRATHSPRPVQASSQQLALA
jgi:hypothetical protein